MNYESVIAVLGNLQQVRLDRWIIVFHESDVPAGRVGSGHDFAGFWRVGSGQHFGFFNFLLIISQYYLNRYESSNTTFGLIDFLRYLIYNN